MKTLKPLCLTILVGIFSSCSVNRLDEFKLGHHSIKIDGRSVKNFEFQQQKVFIVPRDSSTKMNDKKFLVYSNYVYAALELRGLTRVYDPKLADIMVLIDYNQTGPYKITRTGINRIWNNSRPVLDELFESNLIDTMASYEFLKRVRGINDWKQKNQKFLFDYHVWLTRLRLRALDVRSLKDTRSLESVEILWDYKITALGQRKTQKPGIIAAIAGSYYRWGKQVQSNQVSILENNDRRIFSLYEKVVAEVYYQKTDRTQRLFEEYRNLTNREIFEYYLHRKRPYNLNPLYNEVEKFRL